MQADTLSRPQTWTAETVLHEVFFFFFALTWRVLIRAAMWECLR